MSTIFERISADPDRAYNLWRDEHPDISPRIARRVRRDFNAYADLLLRRANSGKPVPTQKYQVKTFVNFD